MTSLQATGHHYAMSFRLLPLPPPCRHEQKSEPAHGLPSFFPSSSSSLSVSLSGPYTITSLKNNNDLRTCGLNSNPVVADRNDAIHPSAGSIPPYSDPEMYALRNMFADMESSGQFWSNSKGSNITRSDQLLPRSNMAVTAKPQHPLMPQVMTNSRSGITTGSSPQLFYVEALVDTTAHIIESIWSSGFTKTTAAPATTTADCARPSSVVPLRTFIQEVLKRSRTTYSTLQTALFYLFRARPAILSQLYKSSMMEWQDAYINCRRRMFLASLVLASKFVQDKTYRNSAWGKIAGLPVAEINAAERIFLDLIKYRLYISHPTFEQWHHLLHTHVEARASSTSQVESRKKRRMSENNSSLTSVATVDSTTSITSDLFHLHLHHYHNHHNHHHRQRRFKKRKTAAETEIEAEEAAHGADYTHLSNIRSINTDNGRPEKARRE